MEDVVDSLAETTNICLCSYSTVVDPVKGGIIIYYDLGGRIPAIGLGRGGLGPKGPALSSPARS